MHGGTLPKNLSCGRVLVSTAIFTALHLNIDGVGTPAWRKLTLSHDGDGTPLERIQCALEVRYLFTVQDLLSQAMRRLWEGRRSDS